MAYSYVRYTAGGSTSNFTFSFPYIDKTHIVVRKDGVDTTAFTFLNDSTIAFNTAPAAGTLIEIRRFTPKDVPIVDFQDGSILLEKDLDLAVTFNLYIAQEADDIVKESIFTQADGTMTASGRRISNVANPVNAQDAVTKVWAETAMASELAQATAQANIATTKATEAGASATSAAGSASTATTKASESATSAAASAGSATASANSATASANSATTSTTKASEASASATAASTSAGNASSSAAAAAGSASNASSSATSAAGSATTATTKAAEALSSANTATTKATEASTSASNAATSASNAASSASGASASATTASTKASEAAASAASAATDAANVASNTSTASSAATSASSSATAAAGSAVSAAASAASAASLLDNFDDRYLGTKASAPTLDNDGNPLVMGALYFDSTAGRMRVYTASGWVDTSSASIASLVVYEFVATAGQTSFSGNDVSGVSLAYTVGALIVSLNGAILRPNEYTASNGTSIVLSSGATAGDELVVYAFNNFSVADTYSRAEAEASFLSSDNGAVTKEKLDVASSDGTGALILPTGTTAQRPATPIRGMTRFNSTTGNPEWYSEQAAAWVQYKANAPIPYNVSYLSVAGGGGGGAGSTEQGGGGGAGGLLTGTLSLTTGIVYSVIVGGGGANGSNSRGTSGSDSTISTVTSIGGGGGASGSTTGLSGGSGGGGGQVGTAGGSGTTGQGYAGGTGGSNGGAYYAGGGGGAGGVGAGNNNVPNGGVGVSSSITGSSVFYAGGGAGSSYSGTAATGGNGGGGNGGVGTGNGGRTSGAANKGGGGGGGYGSGATGGSGVVILSVPTANYSGITSGSPIISVSGSNTILTFNSSGSYTA